MTRYLIVVVYNTTVKKQKSLNKIEKNIFTYRYDVPIINRVTNIALFLFRYNAHTSHLLSCYNRKTISLTTSQESYIISFFFLLSS